MRRLFGARTGVEAVFLIAVPIAALSAGVSAIGIIAASAIAYLLVLLLETGLARGFTLPRRTAPEPMRPASRRLQQQPLAERLVPALAPPAPAEEAEPEPEPERPAWQAEPVRSPQHWQPEPEPEPVVEPEAAPPPAPEPQPEPEPEPAPEPSPFTPVLQAVPPASVEPEAAPVLPPVSAEQAGASVIPLPHNEERRQWNVWDLDRLTRESSGADPARD